MAKNPKEGPIELEAPEVSIEEVNQGREESPGTKRMKVWTIQFEIEEGSDEFWESNPTPFEMKEMVQNALESDGVWPVDGSLKIVKTVDTTEY